jgi:hypothetical protein
MWVSCAQVYESDDSGSTESAAQCLRKRLGQDEKDISQGLKPDCFSGLTARLKSCPDTMPKGLKPSEFSAISGTAEAEPFQNISFVRKL